MTSHPWYYTCHLFPFWLKHWGTVYAGSNQCWFPILCACMLMKHRKSLWVRSSQSLNQHPEPLVLPSARPKQRQRASLSACQGFNFTEACRSTPDRLDLFRHCSTRRHLNNNEVSVSCCALVADYSLCSTLMLSFGDIESVDSGFS